MKRHPLLAFFLLAYGLAWILWTPALLSDYGVGILHINPLITIPLLLIGILAGPGWAGWLLSGLLEGPAGRRIWWGRFIRWRFNPGWYLVAISLPFVVNVVADLASLAASAPTLLAGALASMPAHLPVILTYLASVPVQIIGSPLGEEPGWRGFALPRLQASQGPLKASLVLGGLWGLWHLPLLLFSQDFRGPSPAGPHLVLFVITLTAFSVLMTLLFNATRGSLLAVVLAHAAYNAASTGASQWLFTHGEGSNAAFPSALLFFAWFAAIMMLAAVLTLMVTRGQLGYAPPEGEVATMAPPANSR